MMTKVVPDFYAALNEQQRVAVELMPGPVLVIAGAGSGKTRVISARLAHIIGNCDADPAAIVALTFTNKAAQQMRERIAPLLPSRDCAPFIGTFHAYCLRLLKEFGVAGGMRAFSILDADDQYALIKKLLARAECPSISPRQALYALSCRKNGMGADEVFDNYVLNDLASAYEREKATSNCLDFDDLLIKALELLQDPAFAQRMRERVRHVLVDEYQDTNMVQHEIIKALALYNGKLALDSLCVVGDEDQSIYSWRGATIDNIVYFQRAFMGTTIVKLEQNYRSVKSIVCAAHEVIQNNNHRHDKKIFSNRVGHQSVGVLTCASSYQEAQYIAYAARCVREKQLHATVGVLYRTHAQSRVIEEALVQRRIAYTLVGGVQFYERKEIKDLLAYARLVVNPYDHSAFARIINCPARALGQAFVELFMQCWQARPFAPYSEVAAHLLHEGTLKPRQRDALEKFLAVFLNLSSELCAAQILETICARTKYESFIKDEYEPHEAHERLANIQELHHAARSFDASSQTIEQFLHDVALMQEHDKTNKNNAQVQLMTIHAAKGLEFDVVLLAGLQEGLLPAAKSLENDVNLQEERRLMYVAMTRAKNKLLLLQPEIRYQYGSHVCAEPSRFLAELPVAHVQRVRSYADGQMNAWIEQFFMSTNNQVSLHV